MTVACLPPIVFTECRTRTDCLKNTESEIFAEFILQTRHAKRPNVELTRILIRFDFLKNKSYAYDILNVYGTVHLFMLRQLSIQYIKITQIKTH